MKHFNRLLLTGAAGGLGSALRPALRSLTNLLRVSDIAPLGEAHAGEELQPCELSDKAAVDALLTGVDALVHMGGVSREGPWEPILAANIIGMHHVYEAARIEGVKRIVFASSNHAIGFHPTNQTIGVDCVQRPDSNYGVSKAFGENLSRFYFDRYGLETVCLRIGSSFPEPLDRRMLNATWLSYKDMTELVIRSLLAPKVGHSIVYGMSNNRDAAAWWDNSGAAHLGFTARDSAEPFRAKVEANAPELAENDWAKRYMGGGYCKMGPH
jgi:uronate dehydrogenase